MRARFGWLLIAGIVASCGGPGGAAGDREWKSKVVYSAADGITGLAVGDLDADRAGVELGAVSSNGEIFLLVPGPERWLVRPLARVGGEMIQCATGDADPRAPGDELVAVGMLKGREDDGGDGAIYVVSAAGGKASCERVHVADALVHGVCVADLDPDRDGNEILGVGFDRKAVLVYRDGDGWAHEYVADLPGNGKNAVPFEGGAAIGTSAGTIEHLVKRDGKWVLTTLAKADAGQSRLATDGRRILSAGDDGKLLLVVDGKATPIHSEAMKLRGAVLADLDPDSPGVEAATAGYEKKVTVLHPQGDGWSAETVFTDSGRLHHLVAAELLPDAPGLELATGGYSKNVTILYRSGR